MRGHITKRGKNSYTIVLSLGTDPGTGKRAQHWETIKGSKKDAERRLSKLLTDIDKGGVVSSGKLNLREFLNQWLRDYTTPNLSPRTVETYTNIISQHLIPSLGNLPLVKLTPAHIQSYYARELATGLSSTTVRHYHAVLHSALENALSLGLLARNPSDAVKVVKGKRTDIKTWNEGEIADFLTIAKASPYYQLFYTAIYTGLRRSELLGLLWGDIDLIRGEIHVNRSVHTLIGGRIDERPPKTSAGRRTIDLPPSLSLLLTKYRETRELDMQMLGQPLTDNDRVFCYADGSPFKPSTVTHAFIVLMRQGNLKPISLRELRHTHASLLLKQGIHPKIVQERLGHSSIAITLDIYSHVAPGLQKSAALAFDKALTIG